MQVKFEVLHNGCFRCFPTNRQEQKNIAKHIRKYTGRPDYDCFFQSFEELINAADILRLSDSHIRDLDNGWDIKVNKIDRWEYWHGLIGYCSG